MLGENISFSTSEPCKIICFEKLGLCDFNLRRNSRVEIVLPTALDISSFRDIPSAGIALGTRLCIFSENKEFRIDFSI